MARQSVIPMIRDADRGKLLADMQMGVDAIVNAIELAHGAGTGEITLKLKISSESEGQYTITPGLKISVPQGKRAKMIMFLDDQSGELIRRDPRQPEFPGVETLQPRGQPVGEQQQ